MRYKVGDKVKVREWDNMVKEFGVDENGRIPSGPAVFVSAMKEYCGKCMTIKSVSNHGYKLHEADGEWCWSDSMLIKPHFSKTDLKDGMVCDLRNGTRYLYLSGNLLRDCGCVNLDHVTGDLLNVYNPNFDIMKVGYVDTDCCSLDELPTMPWKEVIWEREESVTISHAEAIQILREHFGCKGVKISL